MLRDYSAGGQLRDGTAVTVRAIRRDDAEAILKSFSAMDRESVFLRFFTYKRSLRREELQALTDVDFQNVVALVVTIRDGAGERLIGGGRYIIEEESVEGKRAELAFVTAAAFRSQGVAGLVLKHLLDIGKSQGVTLFDAEVLAENMPMLNVLKRSGLPMRQRLDGSVVHVTLTSG